MHYHVDSQLCWHLKVNCVDCEWRHQCGNLQLEIYSPLEPTARPSYQLFMLRSIELSNKFLKNSAQRCCLSNNSRSLFYLPSLLVTQFANNLSPAYLHSPRTFSRGAKITWNWWKLIFERDGNFSFVFCTAMWVDYSERKMERWKKKRKKCENRPYGNPNLCIRFMSMELNPICCASSNRRGEKSRKGSRTFIQNIFWHLRVFFQLRSTLAFQDAIKTKIIGKFSPSSLVERHKIFFSLF